MAETILIVDNNPETLELLRRIMERDGYKTILANDGEKGLGYATRYMPDLIILDRLTPKLNGLQVCRKLKEQESTRHIPIVFLTILDAEQDIIDGLKAGADDYITKPFSPDELSVRVERVLFRSVRSVIEDLLSETPTPVTKTGCIEPLVEKLLNTEKKYRHKLRKNLDTLVELCHHWTELLRKPQLSSDIKTGEFSALVSRETHTVKQQTVQFTKLLHDYHLIRWLASLLYRLANEMDGQSTGETPSKLKRMYAESTIILQKIETARRTLDTTDRFLQRRFQMTHHNTPV